MTHLNKRNLPLTIAAVTGLLLGGLSFLTPDTAHAQASCAAGTQPINWTSPQGTTWDMCWRSEQYSGVVLTDVHFNSGAVRRKVLGEVSLAQLYVTYDDGSFAKDYVTQGGIGGTRLRTLTGEDCFGSSAQVRTENGRGVACSRQINRGYMFRHYADQAQGNLFELFSVSDVGAHTWVVRWRFYEDGTFEASVGSTGRLPAFGGSTQHGERVIDRTAKSWISNMFWRLDFDIDGPANDAVHEFKVKQSGPYKETQSRSIRQITSESYRKLMPKFKRSWQILDTVSTNGHGQPISYHLEPQQGGIRYVSSAHFWTRGDLYVTRHKSCERYVMNNDKRGGCGAELHRNFRNGQDVYGENLVLWYRIGRHHLPRDEDQPYRTLDWNSFKVSPRDWDTVSPVAVPQASLLPTPELVREPVAVNTTSSTRTAG